MIRLKLATLLILAIAIPALADEPVKVEKPIWPGLSRTGAVVLPNGWSLKPAGRQVKVGDFPVAIAEHPTEPVLAVLHAGYGEHEVVTLDASSGKVIARVSFKESFNGLTWSSDGTKLFVGGGFDDVVYRFDHAGGLLSNKFTFKYAKPLKTARVPAGLAVSRNGSTLWVANAFGHTLAKFDSARATSANSTSGPTPTPTAWPGTRRAGKLYVSLWAKAEVAVIDSTKGEVVAHWATRRSIPTRLLLSEERGRTLYVANANRNTVSVFDAEGRQGDRDDRHGDRPQGPAGLDPQLARLDARRVAPVRRQRQHQRRGRLQRQGAGREQAAWLHPRRLVSDLGPGRPGGQDALHRQRQGNVVEGQPRRPQPRWPKRPAGAIREYIAALFQGSLSILPIPGPKEMLAYSKTVYECSPSAPGPPKGPQPPRRPPDPGKVGDPSPIKHCVYIVKENRTYDQVFGDLPKGNGEKALCLFPEEVTPNHHALVKEFVLLDNFYAEAEVSADGHEWSMAAYATDFVERTWPLSYRGDRRVPYPSEGALAIARPANGYIWDRAAAKGRILPELRRVHRERAKVPTTPRPPRSPRSRATSTRSSAATTCPTPT